MKINQKIAATLLATSILAFPVIALAQLDIPCGDLTSGGHECGFNDVIVLINNVVKFLMFDVAVPLAAIGFMFMGAKLVLMSNKEDEMTAAKQGLWNIVIGFAIMLGAYVLIKTVLFAFIVDDQKTYVNFLFQ